jgi:hypothetical protein
MLLHLRRGSFMLPRRQASLLCEGWRGVVCRLRTLPGLQHDKVTVSERGCLSAGGSAMVSWQHVTFPRQAPAAAPESSVCAPEELLTGKHAGRHRTLGSRPAPGPPLPAPPVPVCSQEQPPPGGPRGPGAGRPTHDVIGNHKKGAKAGGGDTLWRTARGGRRSAERKGQAACRQCRCVCREA